MTETSAATMHDQAELTLEQDLADPVPLKAFTYKDLLDEEQRLTMELKRNKARVMEDINIIKKKLQPAGQALNFMNKLSGGTGKASLLSTGMDIALDLVSKKYLFRRSGWLVTLAGSYGVRLLSQLFLQKAKSEKNLKQQSKLNGQDHPIAEEEEILNQ